MKTNVDLRTVNLSAYPDLVVIYLGMRVRTFPGIKTLLGLGPQIDKAGAGRPDEQYHLPALPLASRDALVLARFRIDGALDPFRAASPMVATFHARFGRHRILA